MSKKFTVEITDDFIINVLKEHAKFRITAFNDYTESEIHESVVTTLLNYAMIKLQIPKHYYNFEKKNKITMFKQYINYARKYKSDVEDIQKDRKNN